MPLYFFLSGFFFKRYSGFIYFLVRKTNRLLVPFFFFYLLTSVLLPNIAHYFMGVNINTVVGWPSLWAFIYPESFPNVAIWFLWSLFCANMVFYLIHYISKGNLLSIILLSVFCGLLAYLIDYNGIDLPAFFDDTLSHIPFFACGYLVKEYNIFGYNKISRGRSAIVMIMIILVALLPIIPYITGFMCIFILLTLCKMINHLPVVSYFGRYSIMILVTHILVIQIISKAINLLNMSTLLSMFAVLLAMIPVYMLLIPLMRNLLPHVTAQKDLIPQDKDK